MVNLQLIAFNYLWMLSWLLKIFATIKCIIMKCYPLPSLIMYHLSDICMKGLFWDGPVLCTSFNVWFKAKAKQYTRVNTANAGPFHTYNQISIHAIQSKVKSFHHLHQNCTFICTTNLDQLRALHFIDIQWEATWQIRMGSSLERDLHTEHSEFQILFTWGVSL